jgi:hypothetical protein
MTPLNTLLDQIETKIPFCDTSNSEISRANVGWHIEHCLLTLNGVTNFVVQSNPKDYKWTFNFIRTVVMFRKKIPRGRAKAPKLVLPEGNLTQESLQKHLSLTRNKVKELLLLSKDNYFEHPYFGKLKLKQTIEFLEVHTQHHLVIIEDILKAELD